MWESLSIKGNSDRLLLLMEGKDSSEIGVWDSLSKNLRMRDVVGEAGHEQNKM